MTVEVRQAGKKLCQKWSFVDYSWQATESQNKMWIYTKASGQIGKNIKQRKHWLLAIQDIIYILQNNITI